MDWLGNLLDFGGGLISSRTMRKESSRNRAQAQQQFDAQMDQSVQRRVSDARKAGIHPLFALGASAGASPTMSAGGGVSGDPMGSAISRIGQRLAAAALEKQSAGAKRDEAEAALADARAAKIRSDISSQGRDGTSVKTFPYPGVEGPDVVYGPAEYINPQVAVSKSRGIEAGTHPGTIDIIVPDGRRVNIPSPNLGLDEISQVDYVYQRSIHWTTDRLEDYLRMNRRMSKAAKATVRKLHKFFKTPKGYQYQGDTGGDPTR